MDPCQSQQYQKHHEKDLGHRGILVLQIGVCTLPDSGGDLFMVSLPSEKARTLLLWSQANNSATAAPTNPIQNNLSKSYTLL